MSCRSTNTAGRAALSWPAGPISRPPPRSATSSPTGSAGPAPRASTRSSTGRDNWTGAYHFVAGGAIGQLNDYAKANDPFANAGTQAVNVEIVSVLPRSPNTYQVQWRETTFNAGASGLTENWTGIFTTKVNPPKNEAELRANPLGIYITAFQWSREL